MSTKAGQDQNTNLLKSSLLAAVAGICVWLEVFGAEIAHLSMQDDVWASRESLTSRAQEFLAEERDVEWAASHEKLLYTAISDEVTAAYSVEVRCRRTMCLVAIDTPADVVIGAEEIAALGRAARMKAYPPTVTIGLGSQANQSAIIFREAAPDELNP